MGCSGFKEDSLPDNNNLTKTINNFDIYPQINQEYLYLYYYQLVWKVRPTICFFQLKEQDNVERKEVSNFNLLLKQKIISEQNNIESLIKDKLIIIYIHNINGVIITKNKNKVNYYLMNYLDQINDICLVDISNVNILGGEKFSVYELKNQSKYFFDMNNKEIDFSKRNELISMGKNEEIFEKEDIIEDEELEERNKILKSKEIVINVNKNDFIKEGNNEEKESFFQNIEKDDKDGNINKQKSTRSIRRKSSLKIKNLEMEKEILNDIETFKPKKINEKEDLNNLKPKEKKSKKKKGKKVKIKKIKKVDSKKNKGNTSIENGTTNINNIEININITNNHNNINLLSNLSNLNINDKEQSTIIINSLPKYEIKEKTLIIKTYNFTQELNKELEKIFFESNKNNPKENDDDYSPYEHILYICNTEERKKVKKTNRYLGNIFYNLDKNKEKENSNVNLNNILNKDKKERNFIIIHNKNKIPFEQRHCKNDINKIYFDINEFNIDSPFYLKEFIDMIINYKNLSQIKFGQNVNNSSNPNNLLFWKYLKKLFRENFNIRWVSLKDSSLDDNIIDIFLSSLLMKRIRYLNLSNNKSLSNKAMYYLNKFLIKNQTLSVLYLNKNINITVEGIRLTTTALQMHPNITKLDISNIYLEGCGQFISLLLFENKCLKELNLRNIGLSKTDIAFIASKLGEESHLIYLDLGLNHTIGDEGLKEIGKIINNNKSLKAIGLDGLNLTMNNFLPIFEAIIKNRNIESYSLNMNSGLPFKGILNFFLKNQHFKEISIIPWDIEEDNEENKFTEDQIYAIKKFHFKAPYINIKGIRFEDNDEIN